MKSNRVFATLLGAAGLALGLLAAPSVAQAGGGVHWSVGIGAPGVSVGVSNAFPAYGYRGPAPVYVQPRPIYVQPAPIYAQPRPIYAAPPVYYGAPVLVRPAPIYSNGWGPRGPWRHHHRHHRHYRHGPGWRY